MTQISFRSKNENLINTTSLAFLIALSSTGFANEAYIGVDYANIEYEEDFTTGATLGTIHLKAGNQLNENLAGELRLGFGINDDNISGFGISGSMKAKSLYGVYLKAGVPTSTRFYPYLTIGYTEVKVEVEAFGFTTDENEGDVSFGLGTDFNLNETIDLNLEYMSYYDKDGAELAGLSLGLKKSF